MSYERLNENQLKVLRRYRITKGALNVSKLVPHLMPRQKYCVHYLNLKFYIDHGMKLQKIYRVIKFHQSRWMAPYVKKNQDLRATAKNDFEKDKAKLYNNSVYGKTVENQKKHTDIRLVNTELQCRKLCNKPHMMRYKLFSENLAAIELRKTKALINKPFYVGFTVLELSKLLMYRFHYDYIKEKFGNKAELLFTDTDSLMYRIQDSTMYEQFYKDRHKFFDFSEYPETHPLFDTSNKKVVGFFKDEAKGQIITEFVGLRPKMYSYLVTSTKGNGVEEKHRAKGIQREVVAQYRHSDYLKELHEPLENLIKNRRIGSKLHQIYSIETSKRGLCSFDDKRVLLDDEITTMAHGHYRVTGEVVAIKEDEPKIFTGNEEATLEEIIENDIPEGEDPIDFFKNFHVRRAAYSLIPDGALSQQEKTKVFFPENISMDVERILFETIKEYFPNATHRVTEEWKKHMYSHALSSTKFVTTEAEMKQHIKKIILRTIEPEEGTSEDFVAKFTAADFD